MNVKAKGHPGGDCGGERTPTPCSVQSPVLERAVSDAEAKPVARSCGELMAVANMYIYFYTRNYVYWFDSLDGMVVVHMSYVW